ncbi:ABC transporter permease family protein [Anaerocolumna xylanovorans]|uniref:FtsX-like permease family protein n=1 Tax=Anaerocolumna xylanovorans DSM 12503 TaxID=1121345 RepID=A0A1M7Y6V8_9FIRM|nr:hypothetical protein [Anaerocolumna xylanovorans]SHO48340.1 hypothetical protein SAMN02745217_01780 [Anaerocolumna xylanovorans DSM 12503]
MNYNLHQVSKYLEKKSSSYLKVSIFIFICTLISLSSVLIINRNQQNQNDKNFNSNKNVHIIRITSKMSDNTDLQQLTIKDPDYIKSIFTHNNIPEEKYSLSTVYAIKFGITDYETNEALEIYGVTDENKNIIENIKLLDDTLYMEDYDNSSITLDIPVLTIEDGGISSSKSQKLRMDCKEIELKDSPLTLYKVSHKNLKYAYANESAFLKIFKIMNGLSNDVTSLNSPDLENYSVIDELYLFVNNIYDVDLIANLLEKNSYQVIYSLSAFNSLGNSLKSSSILLVVITVVMVLLTSLHLILSFNSFLKLQQKDMGILKFYGYSDYQIKQIYSYNIRNVFIRLNIVLSLFSLTLGFILLGLKEFISILSIVLVLVLIMKGIEIIITSLILKRIVSKDIISLVKTSKEFE